VFVVYYVIVGFLFKMRNTSFFHARALYGMHRHKFNHLFDHILIVISISDSDICFFTTQK
jgi:hypothetical protein